MFDTYAITIVRVLEWALLIVSVKWKVESLETPSELYNRTYGRQSGFTALITARLSTKNRSWTGRAFSWTSELFPSCCLSSVRSFEPSLNTFISELRQSKSLLPTPKQDAAILRLKPHVPVPPVFWLLSRIGWTFTSSSSSRSLKSSSVCGRITKMNMSELLSAEKYIDANTCLPNTSRILEWTLTPTLNPYTYKDKTTYNILRVILPT